MSRGWKMQRPACEVRRRCRLALPQSSRSCRASHPDSNGPQSAPVSSPPPPTGMASFLVARFGMPTCGLPPSNPSSIEPGGGHRVRRTASSHLHDTGGVSNPSQMSNHRPVGAGGGSHGVFFEGKRRVFQETVSRDPVVVPRSGNWSNQKGRERCDFTYWIHDDEGLAHRCSCFSTN